MVEAVRTKFMWGVGWVGYNNFSGWAQNPQKFEKKEKWHNMFFATVVHETVIKSAENIETGI